MAGDPRTPHAPTIRILQDEGLTWSSCTAVRESPRLGATAAGLGVGRRLLAEHALPGVFAADAARAQLARVGLSAHAPDAALGRLVPHETFPPWGRVTPA